MAGDEARRPPRRHHRVERAVGQHLRQRLAIGRDAERKARRQVERKLLPAAGIFQPALDPVHVLRGDPILVLKKAAKPHHRRHLVFRHADALALEIGRPCDAAVGADIDRRVAEHPRQEGRHRDVGRHAARQRDQVGAEADLGHLELAVEIGALEALLHRHGEVVDVAAFDADAAVHQRPHAVVVPGRDGDRQPAHRSRTTIPRDAANEGKRARMTWSWTRPAAPYSRIRVSMRCRRSPPRSAKYAPMWRPRATSAAP